MKKFKVILVSLLWSIFMICFPVISGVIVTVSNANVIESLLIQALSIFICFLIGIIIIVSTKMKMKDNYLSFNKKSWLIYIPSLLVLIPSAIFGFVWKGTDYFFATLFLYLCVGLTEELYFRYFIIEELKKEFDEKLVIIIGTLLFGLGHASVAFNGTDLLMTLLVILNALIFGFMAITLILKSKNIIPLMLIHFLFDFESKFIVMEGNALAIAEFLRGAIMLIYGIIILVICNKKKDVEKA